MNTPRDTERRIARGLDTLLIACWAIVLVKIAICVWLTCAIIWDWEIF